MSRPSDITEALKRLQAGEEGAFDALVPLIYDDLRRLAHRQLAARPAHTLATTGLVHEAYLKLAPPHRATFKDRSHFFAVAARAMRCVLVDYARARRAQKRGGGQPHEKLDEEQTALQAEAEHLVAVNDALDRLAAVDARLARVVECRFFAGLSEEETAEALGVSERTVQRDWAQARAWLKEDMGR